MIFARLLPLFNLPHRVQHGCTRRIERAGSGGRSAPGPLSTKSPLREREGLFLLRGAVRIDIHRCVTNDTGALAISE